MSEQVHQDINSVISKGLRFKKESTLTATLNNLAQQLNNLSSVDGEGTNNTISGSNNSPTKLQNNYVISTQNGDSQLSQISNWTMMSNLNQDAQRQFEVTPLAADPTQFEIIVKPGKDMFEVITALMANTNEAYKFLAPPADSTDLKLNPTDVTSFFHYDTSTINGVFDPITGSYSQTHNIVIVPKVVSRNNFLTSTPGTEQDVNNLMTNNLLIKGYEYLFTGKNTSVLDLNLNFSSMWTDSMNIFLTLLKDNKLSSNLSPNNQARR